MKTILLTACLWMAGTSLAQFVNPNPNMSPVINAGWYGTGCNYYVIVRVEPKSPPSSYTVWFQMSVLQNGLLYGNTYPPSSYSFPRDVWKTIPVSVSGPTTYNLWASDDSPGYSIYPNATTVTVVPSCVIRATEIDITNPGQSLQEITVSPTDPNEAAEVPQMQVRWKLEELDPESGDAVLTIENPANWQSCNQPGVANNFKGFNAFDEALTASLQAGGQSEDPGVFDPAKTYRLTRSYMLPGDDEWTNYAWIASPQQEDQERSAALEGVRADDLRIATDAEHETVIFHTTARQGTIGVYDLSGKEMLLMELQKEDGYEYGWITAGVPKGAYIVKLHSGTGTLSKKFVVQ